MKERRYAIPASRVAETFPENHSSAVLAMDEKIRIGVSSCLLGNSVRYDGGHQHDPYITGTLGRYFEFVPVCPEVECGLPVPREAMRLQGDPNSPRLVTFRTGIDHTDRLLAWARRRVAELEGEDLHGFIFKSKSPSSGMERVKVYIGDGQPSRVGVGLFAREFMRRFPLLPVEDEGRLHDVGLRENFIERLFASGRWRRLKNDGASRGGLVAFHAAHKLQLMAHSEKHYRALGRLVGGVAERQLAEVVKEYEQTFFTAMALGSTVKKNCNVLQHMMGYFKKILSADEKKELLELIDRYRAGWLPLLVPLTLLRHYVRKYGVEYLAGQTYLEPHPLELKLRNHA